MGACLSRVLTAAVLGLMIVPGLARAGDYQNSPPRQAAAPARDWGPWLGPWRAGIGAKMLEDFGEQYIYAPLNAALPPPSPDAPRVVFLGDSITDKWNLAAYFPGKPYVNRGIGGQVTPQMVVRFHADVVALKPAAVVILGGVNDVQGVLQVESEPQIEANYAAMAEMAQANGIRPIFTAILPVNNYAEAARSVLDERKPAELDRINAWLKAYCAAHDYGFIDYGPALRDDKGLMRADYSTDGVHPTPAAYAVMAPIAEKVIEQVLAK
jgi:lysophospholipase L1-like esterase